jgi:predicted AAA+ superfamily ATPase
MLDELREYQRTIFSKNNFSYKRYFHHTLNLDKKLVGLVGARGVGKTTYLIQYLKALDIPFSKKLYISADILTIPSLFEVAQAFAKEEGEVLVIDEIHTPDSSRFWIKETYDGLFSQGEEPQKLDKEYIRQWLAGQGFIGEGHIPVIPDDIKIEAARKYITAY